ncbi:uncharacterized protein LOC116339751 isoform X2 [Contarinia nasturtii]|uniref:uncharacterized protein LOC116339751 isoform X2 n=1 Tax=Contarinia nasturtii TaxID=265458 RepID=UPI0012D4955D|nr:uncharacterized protein LOC116339751 isoform X2 [Contarinia nasturtii]
MNYFTKFVVCASIALSSARPQFGNPFSANPNTWGQSQPQLQTSFQNQGYQNSGYTNPGYSNPGYLNPGFQNQGYQNPGFQNQGFQNQRFPTQPPPNVFYGIQSNPNMNFNRRPGNINQPLNQNQLNGRQPTTEPDTFPAALPAQPQALLDCQSKCITTNQYSPVCGSDRQTYFNSYKLDCTNKCRRQLDRSFSDIQVASAGACIRNT